MNSDLRSRSNKLYLKKVYFQTSKLHTSRSDRVINRNSNMSVLIKEKESISKLIGQYDIQSEMKNAVSAILIQIQNLKKDKDNNRRYVLKKNNKIDLHSKNSIPNSINAIIDNYKAKGYKDDFVNNQTTLFDAHPLLTTNKNDLLIYCQCQSQCQSQSQSQSISSKNQDKALSTPTESLFKGNKYINYLKSIKETIEQKQNIAGSSKQIKSKEKYNKREYYQLDNDCITDWKTKEIMNDNYISEVIDHIDDNDELLGYKLFPKRFNGMNKCMSTDSIIHSQRSNKTSKGRQLMMQNKKKATCKFNYSLPMSKMSGLYNKTSIIPLAQTNSKTIDIKSEIKPRHTIKRVDIKPLSNDGELYKLYETERKKRANCDDVISFFAKSNNKEIKQMLVSPFSKYFPLYTQRIMNHHKEHKLLNWMDGEFSESELRNKFRKSVSTISELNTKLSSFNSTGSSIFHSSSLIG